LLASSRRSAAPKLAIVEGSIPTGAGGAEPDGGPQRGGRGAGAAHADPSAGASGALRRSPAGVGWIAGSARIPGSSQGCRRQDRVRVTRLVADRGNPLRAQQEVDQAVRVLRVRGASAGMKIRRTRTRGPRAARCTRAGCRRRPRRRTEAVGAVQGSGDLLQPPPGLTRECAPLRGRAPSLWQRVAAIVGNRADDVPPTVPVDPRGSRGLST
jgi:hypothetical protein